MPTDERTMAADPLDDYIDAVAKALALPVDDAWKPAVRANLEVSLRLARLVDEFALPDETEPASVFAACPRHDRKQRRTVGRGNRLSCGRPKAVGARRDRGGAGADRETRH